jgi:NAD(P)H-dependent FMN reductase
MLKLNVIIASTRPGRVGLPVGNWFFERAKKHGGFSVELSDLKEINLPMFDEPRHPRLGQYEHTHTKAWSATVKAADAFVIVTPEYNFFTPPALLNAIDYLSTEWNFKPAAFVSYGGISGGMRSVQMTKLLLLSVKMAPIFESVTIPFVTKHVLPDGTFQSSETFDNAAKLMLDELHRWTEALKAMRA